MKLLSRYKFIFIMSVVALVVACVPVQGLYVAPSFTYQSIAQDNIGVGGVTSGARHLTQSRENTYANLLSNAMIGRYPGMNVMPAGDTVRALGSKRYRDMMDFYRQNGVIQDQYLSALKHHVKNMRYIAFARIVDDQISRDRQENHQYVNKHYSRTVINFVTSLHMQVHMVVYDLSNHQIVWSGTVSEDRQNSNEYALPGYYDGRHYHYKDQIINNLTDILARQEISRHHRYPSAPSDTNLLQNIFSALVRKFPDVPKQN